VDTNGYQEQKQSQSDALNVKILIGIERGVNRCPIKTQKTKGTVNAGGVKTIPSKIELKLIDVI